VWLFISHGRLYISAPIGLLFALDFEKLSKKTMLKMCFLFSNTTIVYLWCVRRHGQQEMPAKITQFCGGIERTDFAFFPHNVLPLVFQPHISRASFHTSLLLCAALPWQSPSEGRLARLLSCGDAHSGSVAPQAPLLLISLIASTWILARWCDHRPWYQQHKSTYRLLP